MSGYMTDGVHLYEVAAERVVENAGCFWRSGGRHGPIISFTVLRDCVSEETGRVGQLDLLALTPVAG